MIRTYNVLRLLARDFDVTALCFYRIATHGNTERLLDSAESLRAFAKVEVFPIPQEHSRTRLVFDHLRSALTRRAYTVFAYDSDAYRGRLRELLSTETFELAHVDSLDLATYIPELEHLPVVCVHHNVESRLLWRRALAAGGALGRYMALQARLTEKEERTWCPRVALNVVVSRDDRETFLQLAPEATFIVVPNGVDTDTFRPADIDVESQQGVVFVGGFTWQPNRDAMNFFASNILPILRADGLDSRVTWIGRAPERVVQDYAERHRVHLTGYVDDIRPLVARAACYVAPLLSGGGTRLKILDAWAMGKAVVSTSVGCEGLEAQDGTNILIRDDPTSFAEAVSRVLRDPQLRQSIGTEARKTAESLYDWEVIGQPMLARYRELCSASSEPSAP
jgi:polysaccharide biosynthesis protein PslH